MREAEEKARLLLEEGIFDSLEIIRVLRMMCFLADRDKLQSQKSRMGPKNSSLDCISVTASWGLPLPLMSIPMSSPFLRSTCVWSMRNFASLPSNLAGISRRVPRRHLVLVETTMECAMLYRLVGSREESFGCIGKKATPRGRRSLRRRFD